MPDDQSIIRLSFTINMDGAVSRNNTVDEQKEVVAVVGVTAGRRFLMARPPVLTGQNGEVLKIFFFINRRSSVDNVTNSLMVFSAWHVFP
jgi:hypothetical protein